MDNLLEFIGFAEMQDDPCGDFLTKVANGPLLDLAAKRQSGVHHGQTLYGHLLNVVLLTDFVAQLVGCTPAERRVLICAAVLHDLNKLDPEHRDIKHVANTETVSVFLEKYALDQLLIGIPNAVEIVRRLIAAHSAHLHQGGDSLLPLSGPITRERLRTVLAPLLKLSDSADVARNLGDRRKQEQVLIALNAVSDTQYRLEWHRLNEYRGAFSNLLHNAAIAEMADQLGAKPFLHYGDGTLYLTPAFALKTLADDTIQRVSNRFSQSVKRLKGGNASDFVSGSPVGIKINAEIFATGLTLKDAFLAAGEIILARAFKGEAIAEMELKARRRAKQGYETLCDANGNLYSRTRETMQIGESLRVIYNFLQAHCSVAFKGKGKKYNDAWQPIYKAFDVETPKSEWALLDALNDRAYVVARALHEERGWEFASTLDRATEIAETFERDFALRGETAANPVFAEYVRDAISFSCLPVERTSFAKHLKAYSNDDLDACSLCGAPLPAQAMMAGDVPKGLVVAQFSNRNLAGTGDPKRNSCAICREQLLIEKIGFASALSKGFYLHVYPESFAPPPLLDAMRSMLSNLVSQNNRSLLFETREIAKEYEKSGILKLSFKSKATGLALPTYSELVGNIITLPIYPLGDNDSERYLFAMVYALFIQRRFGQRVVLTQSAAPPVTVAEMQEQDLAAYFDDMPGVFRGLLPGNAASGHISEPGETAEIDRIFNLLHDLKVIADKIGTGEHLIDLVRSLNDGELGVFFVAHRIIEKNSKNEGVANATGGDLSPRLTRVAASVFELQKKGLHMTDVSLTSILERMAELAWKKTIRGGSLTHNALMKPVDIAFQLVRRQSSQEVSFLKLVAAENILRHIDRTSDYSVGAGRSEAITEWTRLFFDELLAKGFNGEIRRMIRNEKLVKAAYTTLMREHLRKSSEAKKADGEAKKALPDNATPNLFQTQQ
jgi:CRISPR-associated protein Csc3